MSDLRVPNNNKIADIAELAEIGRTARIIFHDLSNHLTALSLSVDQLKERSEHTRAQMEYVSKLLRSHLDAACEPCFDPITETQNIVKLFFNRATAEKVKINFLSTGKIRLPGGRKAFAHIVTNLITNALESFACESFQAPSQATKVEKRIDICLSSKQNLFSLTISDNGAGISHNNIDKIFGEGFTTKSAGHGLGLCAVKENVENVFNGRIEVRSSNDGTTFAIEIPTRTKAKPRNLRLKLKPRIRVTFTEMRRTSVTIENQI